MGVAGVQCEQALKLRARCLLCSAVAQAVAQAVAPAPVYAFIKHQTKSKTSRIHDASYIVSSSRSSSSSRILHVFCIQMQSRQLAIYAHNLSRKTKERAQEARQE